MAEQVVNSAVPVEGLRPHPANYNAHPAGQIERLRLSLRKFGQPRSIVVQAPARGDGTYLIVAGHGVVLAAAAEGWTTLRADVLPADWPATRVKAYLAADNELGRYSEPDEALLAAIVAEAQSFDEELAVLAAGSEERLKELIDAITQPGADEWGEALGNLPEGDRAPFQQMTFTVSDQQAEDVKAALAKAKAQGAFVDTGNENSNGNALARICETWMTNHGR